VAVGKSKLRKPKDVALGPQYRGSRVSRDAVIDDEDEDDPFERGFDEEESEDEEDADIDDEEDEDGDEDEEDASDIEDEETPDTDLSDDERDARPRLNRAPQPSKNVDVRSAVRNEEKAVAASLSQKGDAEKGRAVKIQRKAFDSLLGTRMKLQKALISVNTLSGLPEEDIQTQKQDASIAFEAAETAAFNLWSSLTTFREELRATKTGQKRKRPAFSIDTPTSDLWSYVQDQEEAFKPARNATITKWAEKARAVTALPERKDKQLVTTEELTIMDVINQDLANLSRLLNRARTPRSCAPLQLSKRLETSAEIYDDADFYGQMLKELLERKSKDSVAAANVDITFGQLRREAKAKKNVDTKASKGRKLRYTVHEKLQNFMAPEPELGSWGEKRREELFGSLFGRTMTLGDEEVKVLDGEGEEDENLEEAGLVMFGGR
jgi:protein AATF/BFR2